LSAVDCSGIFFSRFSRQYGSFYNTCGKRLGAVRWAHNQPDNWRGNENCVEMLLDRGRQGQLNDSKCDHKKGFICQYKVKGCEYVVLSFKNYCGGSVLKTSLMTVRRESWWVCMRTSLA
jgi:hypothetical protein